ncbi:ornithine cyclodeaminase family protein [Mesorhizobium sp. GR13]|uniref:ornithine cyclodeaminase family protein n=1 Tax=Mesorhizobium sp. GR13 TaxID=2562308 RepID=UPI0010C0F162|nr:ornithine cyclodeaminase family protein [Mesorhizobium sp. GR13]
MRFLNREEVYRLADYPAVIDTMAAMYANGCDAVDRMILSQPTADGDQGDFLLQSAWLRGRAFGVKIANVFPCNEKRGLPSIHGLYVLFDGNTGEALGCIDGSAETNVKTACNSAVASRFLALPDASTMLMMGAGELAPYLIAAHASIRPIRNVMIWNRTTEKAKALAARLNKPGFRVEAVTDPAEAASQADIISCATYSTEPILKGEWLKAGAHVDLVGSYRPDLRESNDEVMRKARRLFVDERSSTVEISGDVIEPLTKGLVRLDDIIDLFELAQGRRPGRRSDDEITVFKSGGGGHEDLATAIFLFERANSN